MNIVLRESKLQPYFFRLLIVAVMLFIFFLDIHWYQKCIAIVLLGIGIVVCKNQTATRLQKISSDIWQVEYYSGKVYSGTLLGSSLSTPYFSILVLKSSEHYLSKKALIFKDALNNENYHLLRLYLKGLLH